MRRHPLRIGLTEHNATVGLLAVQGVPPGAIMPMMEGLESLALGSAAYESGVIADTEDDNWQDKHPYLYHASRSRDISRARTFEILANAVVAAIMGEYEGNAGLQTVGSNAGG
jgi:hypothetical protein